PITVQRLIDGSVDGTFQGFPTVTSTGATVNFQGGSVYGEWTSEFVATPGDEVTSTLEFDCFFPGGLAYISDEGALQNRSVGVECEYRNLDGGPRVSINREYARRTLDPVGITERVGLPAARVACRARRIGASFTTTQMHDHIHWYGLKCRLPTR